MKDVLLMSICLVMALLFFETIKRFLNDMCRDENVCVGRGRNEGWPLSL